MDHVYLTICNTLCLHHDHRTAEHFSPSSRFGVHVFCYTQERTTEGALDRPAQRWSVERRSGRYTFRSDDAWSDCGVGLAASISSVVFVPKPATTGSFLYPATPLTPHETAPVAHLLRSRTLCMFLCVCVKSRLLKSADWEGPY